MTEKKQKSRRVTSFEDWSTHVKRDLEIRRSNGDVDVFAIQSVTEKDRLEMSGVYQEMVPAKPSPPLDRKGNPRLNDPHYIEAMQEHKKGVAHASNVLMALYIDKGWAEPNGFSIPGDTPEEKFEALQGKIAGDIETLYMAIVNLSGLGQDDINFFGMG